MLSQQPGSPGEMLAGSTGFGTRTVNISKFKTSMLVDDNEFAL
jgi:hypothetical protein